MFKFRKCILKSSLTLSLLGIATMAFADESSETSKQPRAKSDSINNFFSRVKENASAYFSTDPSVSILVQALKAADMYSILQSKEPFTIFAPNNAAFSKLPPGTLSDLLKSDSKDKLIAILKYHQVPTKLIPADLKSMKITAANGKELEITVVGSEISVNGAKVIKTETIGNNGMIYIIDTVLLP